MRLKWLRRGYGARPYFSLTAHRAHCSIILLQEFFVFMRVPVSDNIQLDSRLQRTCYSHFDLINRWSSTRSLQSLLRVASRVRIAAGALSQSNIEFIVRDPVAPAPKVSVFYFSINIFSLVHLTDQYWNWLMRGGRPRRRLKRSRNKLCRLNERIGLTLAVAARI